MSFSDFVNRFLLERPSRQERDRKKVNIDLDGELFMRMCKTLYSEAPKGAEILVMEAKLPLWEDDASHRKINCFVKKSTGKNVKFIPSAQATQSLFEMLQELRESMKRQNHPVWKGFKIIVDVPMDKYTADFEY